MTRGGVPPLAGSLRLDHVEHVFARQWFEVEPIAGVVVGADGLRIAVDHHRLVAGVAERERGVHAAVVELDALPDAIRAAAEDDDAWSIATNAPRSRLRRSSSGTGSARRTPPRTCRRSCTSGMTPAASRSGAHSQFVAAPQMGELAVAEAHLLDTTPLRAVTARRAPVSANAARSSTICSI